MLSKDSDHPVHSCSLIRIFTGHILDSLKDAKFLHADKEVSDQPVWPLLWAHMSEGMYSDVTAQLHLLRSRKTKVPYNIHE